MVTLDVCVTGDPVCLTDWLDEAFRPAPIVNIQRSICTDGAGASFPSCCAAALHSHATCAAGACQHACACSLQQCILPICWRMCTAGNWRMCLAGTLRLAARLLPSCLLACTCVCVCAAQWQHTVCHARPQELVKIADRMQREIELRDR